MSLFSRWFKPDVPAKRLAGILVTMQTARADADELCERLLDQERSEFSGHMRRWALDGQSWYGFVRLNGGAEVAAAAKKLHDNDGLSQDEIRLVATVMKLLQQECGVPPTADNTRIEPFDYDGHPGAVMMIVEDRAILRDSSLKCRGCGAAFDFGGGAAMVTDEQMFSTLAAANVNVVLSKSSSALPGADLVSPESPYLEHRTVSPHVLTALRANRYRRWCCKPCGRVQGYPGSFYRDDL